MLDDLLGSSVALGRERDREPLCFLGISLCGMSCFCYMSTTQKGRGDSDLIISITITCISFLQSTQDVFTLISERNI